MAHTVVVLSLELLHISHLHNSPHAALVIAGKHKTTNKQPSIKNAITHQHITKNGHVNNGQKQQRLRHTKIKTVLYSTVGTIFPTKKVPFPAPTQVMPIPT